MTLLFIFFTAIIVWLNRGRYDPSVPVLTVLFLKWVYSTCRNQVVLPRTSQILLSILPWFFALLFMVRNELLYVAGPLLLFSRLISFLPLVGLALLEWSRKFKFLGIGVLILPLALTLFLSPDPHIDVFQSNRAAVDFFLHGINPYSATYPEIYKNEFDYHPGFLYWPTALYLQTLSQVLFHDIRAILVLAWVASGFMLRQWKVRIAVWLCFPFLAFGFEQAWLDPLISLGGVLALFGLRKQKNWIWVLGVVLAASVKQYGFTIGLFSILYAGLEGGLAKIKYPVLSMAVCFFALMAPLISGSPSNFLNMTVLSHATSQIRPDALNFTAFWLRTTGQAFPPSIQLLAILIGFGIALFHVIQNRGRRGMAVIPEAWAMFFGFSIFFGKFAFCNYYWLLLSFCWMAVSESGNVDESLSGQKVLRLSTEGRPDRKLHSV